MEFIRAGAAAPRKPMITRDTHTRGITPLMLHSRATTYRMQVITPAFLMPSLKTMPPMITEPMTPMTAMALMTPVAMAWFMPTSMLRATSWVMIPIWTSIRKPVDSTHSQVSLVASSLPTVQPWGSSSGAAAA